MKRAVSMEEQTEKQADFAEMLRKIHLFLWRWNAAILLMVEERPGLCADGTAAPDSRDDTE